MVKINIKHDEAVLLLLDFLKQNDYIKALRSLEEESNIRFETYGKELNFLRNLVLDGQWTDVEAFIKPLATRPYFDYKKVLFEVKKQKFLELLESQSLSPAVVELVDGLKELEDKCSREEFNNLCYCLTLPRLTDHADYHNWTVHRGRMQCFENIRPLFDQVYPDSWLQRRNASRLQPNRLIHLLKQAMLYQVSVYCDDHPNEELANPLFLTVLKDFDGKPAGEDDDGPYAAPGSGYEGASEKPTMLHTVGGPATATREPMGDLHQSANGDQMATRMQALESIGFDTRASQGILKSQEVQRPPSTANSSYVRTDEPSKNKAVAWTIDAGDLAAPGSMPSRAPRSPPPREVLRDSQSGREGYPPGGMKKDPGYGRPGPSSDASLQPPPPSRRDLVTAAPAPLAPLAPHADVSSAPAAPSYGGVGGLYKHQASALPADTHEAAGHGVVATGQFTHPEHAANPFHGIHPKQFQTRQILRDMQAIRTVAFNNRGDAYAVGTNSKYLKICGVAPSHFSSNYQDEYEVSPAKVLHQRADHHVGSVYCCSWNSEDKLIATGSNDRSVKVVTSIPAVNYRDGWSEFTLMGHSGTVRDVKFGKYSPYLLVSAGAGDNTVRVWDVEVKRCVTTLDGHEGSVLSLAFASNDQMLVSGSQDGTVRVWDLRQQHCVAVLNRFRSSVSSVCVDTTGVKLACGYEDAGCCVWDIGEQSIARDYHHHKDDCRSVDWSADGRWLLTGSFDGTVGVVDDRAVETDAVLREHTDRVIQARWSPVEPVFVSSSADKSVRYWSQ